MAVQRVLRNTQATNRFLTKVRKTDECWWWTACTNSDGYGSVSHQGRILLAHRLAWMLFRGPIPGDSCVLHRCDNRACVNPAHLFLGNRIDNARDMLQRGRHPDARLPLGAATQIRKLYSQGFTQVQLAQRFGVSQARISQITRGKGLALA